ncbi:MAG: hypothetical protein LW650_06795 [Planctomycetaceae bacterium]|jgi:hypothetical protein|nr:hypothetical protein [Phycisphaerales bacterium]MCE2653207.1 hypothetical protein [Planctomycetaceae bacterium]
MANDRGCGAPAAAGEPSDCWEAPMGITAIFIAGLLGSWAWAEVTASLLWWAFPDDIEPDCAKRVTGAARWFALLYPTAIFGGLTWFTPAVAKSIGPLPTGFIAAFVPAALACLPLAIAIGRSTRSLRAGATPMVAIAPTVAVLAVVIGFMQPFALFLWFIAAPPVWLVCTIIGLRWVVRPRWPRMQDRVSLCGSCGYSRAGLTADLCPECGSLLPVQPAPGTSRTG